MYFRSRSNPNALEPNSHRIGPFILLLAVSLPAVVFLFPKISPVLLFAAVIAAFAAIAAAFYWPAAFLVLPIFAPQFKSLPGLGSVQSQVDLTLLALCCAALAILLHSILGSQRDQLTPSRFSGSAKQITAFFFFAIIVAGSYLYTPAPEYGGVKLVRFLLIGGFFLLAPLYLIKEEEDFRHFALTFVLFGIVQSFLLFVRVGHVSTSPEDTDVTRIGAGWLVGMAILLLLFYRVALSPFWRKALIIFGLPCLIGGLIASASRGAVFSVALAAVILAFKISRGRSKVAVLGVVIFVAICAGCAFYYLRGMGNGKYSEKYDELIALSHGQQTTASGGERLAFYSAALREIPQRPLLGIGVGGWSVYYYGADVRRYPHNLFLEVSVEEGLIGIIGLCTFLWTIWSANRELSEITGVHFVVLSGLLIFALTSTMFSGDLDDDRLLWLWSGMILAMVHFARVQFAQQLSLGQQMTQQANLWQRQPAGINASLVR
jgi:O-antigen ligase